VLDLVYSDVCGPFEVESLVDNRYLLTFIDNVSYSHLRVFGCKAYVHIPKEHRSKLDDKATPCIFLG
jgi:hypothetical protein